MMLSASALAPTASAIGPFTKLSAEMTERRYAPAAATLPNGKVLVSGGYNAASKEALATAELFDPATGTFATLAAAPAPRGEACYATLADGRVLIAGGTSYGASLKTAQVFNPKTEAFVTVGEMAIERDGCAAATLPEGKVLIVDGVGTNEASNYKKAELFDPSTNTFESISAETATERYEPAAVSLADGKVLVVGGGSGGETKATAELFDPGTGKFEPASHEVVERREELAYLAAYGGALLLGGDSETAPALSSVELFDAASGSFEKLGSELTEARDGPAAARLQNGSVLVLGGYRGTTYLRSAEFAPRTLNATTGGSSALTPSTATLAGTALAEIPASAHFQYGTSTSYGSSTAAQAIAPSTVPAAVGTALTGLLPGTTYHYRLIAEDGGGPVYGADLTFTSAAPASAPPAGAPPGVTPILQTLPSNAFSLVSKKISKAGAITLELEAHAPGELSGVATFVRAIRTSTGKGRHRHIHKTHKTITYGNATATANANVLTQLTITPSAAAGKLLRRLRTLQVTVTISFTPAGGRLNKQVLKVKLTAPKPKKRSRRGH